MPSVVHRLGELEHVCDRHNLKLKTNGYITLSSTQSSSCLFDSDFQDLDALISSGTWITGANRLWLHIELLFDDISVSGSSMSQITEDIGAVLCNAELWSQLCLDASLTIDDSENLYMSLSTQSLSNADIRPPRLMPSTCIEKIGLSFHFFTCRRIRNALKAPDIVSGCSRHHTLTLANPIHDHLGCPYHSPSPSPGAYQNTSKVMYKPWNLPTSLVGTLPVSSQDSVLSNAHSTSLLDAPTTGYNYATQDVTFGILVQMVDFSFRRMLSDNKPVRPGGVILSSDAGCPKLAAISPDFFSPGYVKAVSQRTALLPTIARTLIRVYRRTNSSGLRNKLKRLQQISVSADLDRDSTKESVSSSVVFLSRVEVRLWFLTRSKLIDTTACRGLKSLNISKQKVSGSHEMLDETIDGAEDVMLDEEQASIFDAYGHLDTPYHVDLFQEHSLDGISDEVDHLDGDLFWGHSQNEVDFDRMEIFDNDTTSSVHSEPYAELGEHLHSNLGTM